MDILGIAGLIGRLAAIAAVAWGVWSAVGAWNDEVAGRAVAELQRDAAMRAADANARAIEAVKADLAEKEKLLKDLRATLAVIKRDRDSLDADLRKLKAESPEVAQWADGRIPAAVLGRVCGRCPPGPGPDRDQGRESPPAGGNPRAGPGS